MLRLLSRRKPTATLPIVPPVADLAPRATPTVALAADRPATACALSACLVGARATVLDVGCGDHEACRLRALGLCEGASVSVVSSRGCTLLEVRGARLALSSTIASGITVLPVA